MVWYLLMHQTSWQVWGGPSTPIQTAWPKFPHGCPFLVLNPDLKVPGWPHLWLLPQWAPFASFPYSLHLFGCHPQSGQECLSDPGRLLPLATSGVRIYPESHIHLVLRGQHRCYLAFVMQSILSHIILLHIPQQSAMGALGVLSLHPISVANQSNQNWTNNL